MQEDILKGLEPTSFDSSVYDNSLSSDISPQAAELAATIQNKEKFNLNNLNNKGASTTEAPKSFMDNLLQPKGLDLGGIDVNPDLVTDELSSGDRIAKFDTFDFGVNNEEVLAQNQSAWEKSLNGMTKYVAKTGLNFLDATVGTVAGVKNGISEGSLEAIYNNDFSNYIDDLNKTLDNKLPNYYTENQKNMGFLDSLTGNTANFLANDVLGGLSFLTGTIASEAAWAYATGGASLFAAIPKVASKLAAKSIIKAGAKSAGKKLYKNTLKLTKAYQRSIPASNFGKIANNARYMYTSAAYESGVEARHSLNESLENFVMSYSQANGEEPSQSDKEAFLLDATDASNNVFRANLALVGASNIAQFGSYFGVGTGLSKGASKSIGKVFGGGLTKGIENGRLVYKAIKPTKAQKVLGNTFSLLKSPITEGVIEEGGQSVISGTSQEWLASRYNPTALESNLSLIDAIGNSLEETYGTAQGRKEIGLGMIIGALGDRGGRAISKRGVWGTDFADRIKSAPVQADYLTKAADKLTEAQRSSLDRLIKTNQFTTYTNKAERASEKGDFTGASLAFDTAQFTKLSLEDSADMLEDSVADFEMLISNTPDSKIASEYNISEESVKDYKSVLISDYKQNFDLYKKSKNISEALGLEDIKIAGVSKDYSEELSLNIFLGVKSAQRASNLADSISEVVGDDGLASALKVTSNIRRSSINRARTVAKLQRELNTLENDLARLQTSFDSTNLDSTVRQKDNVKVAKKLTTKEAKRAKLVERLSNKRIQLQGVRSQLDNTFFESRSTFGGEFNVFNRSSEFLTSEEVTDSVAKLEELESYLQLLKDRKSPTADILESLMSDYVKSVSQFKEFNQVFTDLTSSEFNRNSYTGVLKAFNDKSKVKDLKLDEVSDDLRAVIEANPDLSQSEVFTLKVLSKLANSFNNKDTGIDFSRTDSKIEDTIVSSEEYSTFIDTGNVSEEVINNLARKIKANTGQPNNLGEKEFAIFTSKTSEINEALQKLKLEEGDDLSSLIQEQSPEERFDQETLTGRLKTQITKIKNNKNFLSSFDVDEIVESDKPTNKEYSRFEELLSKVQQNALTPTEIDEFNNLKDKINRWGALEGTLTYRNTSLADLIEQVFLLEQNNPITNETANQVSVSEVIGGEGFISDRTNEYYDNLQNPDSATFFKENTGSGKYNISNMSVDLLLDILSKSVDLTVTQGGTPKRSKNGVWNLSKNIGDKFSVNLGDNKIVVEIGERKRLKISPKGVNLLNTYSNLVIDRTNLLPTNFQVVLEKVGLENGKTKLVPVQSDSTYANGMRVDTDAIYNLKPDDEIILQVDTNDNFNQGLLDRYSKATSEDARAEIKQEMEKSLSIYAKDKNNNFLGVHKDRSFSRFKTDENADALDKIRKVAVQKVLDETVVIGDIVDIGVTIPVSRVYIGHPNLNISSTGSTLNFEATEITDRVLSQIQDVGYIENGKLTLKENTKGVEIYPFGDKIMKQSKFQGVKVPIVDVNFKGRKILYPVSLKRQETNVKEDFVKILNSKVDTQQKILSLNQFLIRNGINVEQFGVTEETLNSQNFETIYKELESVFRFASLNDWMTSETTKESILKERVNLNIDLNTQAFHSPKIKTKITEAIFKDELIFDENTLAEDMSKLETTLNEFQKESCKK